MGAIQLPAIFLDRDGVLTEPVWNPATREYESPHTLPDLRLCDNAIAPLQRLHARGFSLFIVSNQPSYAKGKTSLEDIQAIAQAVTDEFGRGGVTFQEAYYCYHHPRGIVAGFSGPCPCRKPSSYFLHLAAEKYGIDLRRSWMLGDRDSDIECGQRAGCRTILITHPRAKAHQGTMPADYVAHNIGAAAEMIELAELAGAIRRTG